MSNLLGQDRRWQNRPILGILLMTFGLALYPISDAFVKHLMGTYSIPQTCFLRGLTRLVPLMIAVLFQGGIRHVFLTKQKKLHVIRLFVSLIYTYAFMFSFSVSSLTTVYTLSYTSSFFMIIFSALFLKEIVSKKKWAAVFLGMLGVIIAIRPTFGIFEITSTVILAGALLGALNKVLMRKLAKTEHSLSIAIYPNLLMIVVTFPFLIKLWQPMPLSDWGLFAIVGLLTAGAQFTVAQALRFTEASSLAPVDYSGFLWVLLLDSIYWSKSPDLPILIGATFIISSNLYILYATKKEDKSKKIDNPLS